LVGAGDGVEVGVERTSADVEVLAAVDPLALVDDPDPLGPVA